MSYTPTTWVTGDTITATKLNKMEQGIAGAGGGAIVQLTVNGYGTQSWLYGYIVYGIYDDVGSRWVVFDDDSAYWSSIFGFANNAPRLIPPYLTILPNDDDIGVFFLEENNATVSVTGDINAANLYYSWGSPLPSPAYRITGNGSISLVAN